MVKFRDIRKIIILIFSVFFVFILVGCKDKSQDKKKIAYISYNDERRENNVSNIIMNVIEQYKENYEISYSNVNSDENLLKRLDSYANDKYNLIITSSFKTITEVENISDQNKDSKFVVLDSVVDPVKDNVKSIMFNTNESSFLVGYIAGLHTQTNAVGYVGFESGLVSDKYEYGFKAGVLQAAKEKNVEISIFTKQVDTFKDFEEGRKIADEIYNNGADIIYQTVGATGLGVIDSAKRNGKWVIGYDIDQSYLAPKNVLVSSVKKFDFVTNDILSNFGSNKLKFGEKLYLGLKDNAVDISEYNKEKSIYSEENHLKVLEIKEKIISGQLNIPFDRDSYEDFK